MYNFGGIYYEMRRIVGFSALVGVMCLLSSKFWNVHKRNMKNMIFGQKRKSIQRILIKSRSIESFMKKKQKQL